MNKFFPISKQVDAKSLLDLLKTPRSKKRFCFHGWIYWRFGIATKIHRVCNKCFKKQKDANPITIGTASFVNDEKNF